MTFYVIVMQNLLFIKGFLVEYGRRPHALRCEPLNKNDPIVEEKGSYDRANGTHTRRGSGSGGTGGASVFRGGVARSQEISSSLTCVGSLPLFLSLCTSTLYNGHFPWLIKGKGRPLAREDDSGREDSSRMEKKQHPMNTYIHSTLETWGLSSLFRPFVIPHYKQM